MIYSLEHFFHQTGHFRWHLIFQLILNSRFFLIWNLALNIECENYKDRKSAFGSNIEECRIANVTVKSCIDPAKQNFRVLELDLFSYPSV